jgi:hypothetical protein
MRASPSQKPGSKAKKAPFSSFAEQKDAFVSKKIALFLERLHRRLTHHCVTDHTSKETEDLVTLA